MPTSQDSARTPTVDVHGHMSRAEVQDIEDEFDKYFQYGMSHRDNLLLMDAVGVDKQIIHCCARRGTAFQYLHKYVRRVMREYPDRFGAITCVDERKLPHDEGLERIRRDIEDWGFNAWWFAPWPPEELVAAGLDPNSPPTTLDALRDQAVQCTQRDDDGNLVVEGFVADPAAQDHHWFREVLVRQFGGVPYNDDTSEVLYNDEAGLQAWNYLLAFHTELATGDRDLFDGSTNAFVGGHVCFHVDGSFRLGTLANNSPDMNFGVTELPEHNGVKSTFGSYWTHGLTKKAAADPARFEASVKFLQHITSPEAGALWVGIVGELPAQLEAGSNPELLADEKLGAFAAGLEYAYATFFADESKQRQAIIDAVLYLSLFFPAMIFFLLISYGFAEKAWVRWELTMDTAWMAPVAPVRTAMPLGALFLIIQGISELLKCIYAMQKNRWP